MKQRGVRGRGEGELSKTWQVRVKDLGFYYERNGAPLADLEQKRHNLTSY